MIVFYAITGCPGAKEFAAISLKGAFEGTPAESACILSDASKVCGPSSCVWLVPGTED